MGNPHQRDLILFHVCYSLGLESKLLTGGAEEQCFWVNPETPRHSFNQKTQTFQLLQVFLPWVGVGLAESVIFVGRIRESFLMTIAFSNIGIGFDREDHVFLHLRCTQNGNEWMCSRSQQTLTGCFIHWISKAYYLGSMGFLRILKKKQSKSRNVQKYGKGKLILTNN